jgi:hypothetical protein
MRMRNAYKILIGKHEAKRPLGRLSNRWDNIKTHLKEIRFRYQDGDWINPTQGTVMGLVTTTLAFRSHKRRGIYRLTQLLSSSSSSAASSSRIRPPSDSEFNFFEFIDLSKFGRTPWTGDQPDARHLPTQDNTIQTNADTYPCPELDANPQS